MITSARKKEILRDWKEQFPILSEYSSTNLYMKLDIALLGLHFDRFSSDEYRLILTCIPLWGSSNIKALAPIFMIEILDKKKLQLIIPYQLHEYMFPIALECVEKQVGFVLKENVLINDIFEICKPIVTNHNPIDLYRLFEFKLALALYFDDVKLKDNIKIEIEKESKLWEPKRFKSLFEKSIEEWKDDLYRKFENRNTFIEQLNQNVSDKKISKLKSAHLLF